MFISRTAHAAIVVAKDQQIARLMDEVSWLRRMIQPDRALSPKVQIEADLALEGRQDAIVDDEKQAALDTEAAQLLSGNY